MRIFDVSSLPTHLIQIPRSKKLCFTYRLEQMKLKVLQLDEDIEDK